MEILTKMLTLAEFECLQSDVHGMEVLSENGGGGGGGSGGAGIDNGVISTSGCSHNAIQRGICTLHLPLLSCNINHCAMPQSLCYSKTNPAY